MTETQDQNDPNLTPDQVNPVELDEVNEAGEQPPAGWKDTPAKAPGDAD